MPVGVREGVDDGTGDTSSALGLPVGVREGVDDGMEDTSFVLGVLEGRLDGFALGLLLGVILGVEEGALLGEPEGAPEGWLDGISLEILARQALFVCVSRTWSYIFLGTRNGSVETVPNTRGLLIHVSAAVLSPPIEGAITPRPIGHKSQ